MQGRKESAKEKQNKFIVFFIAFIMISSAFAVIFYGFNEGQPTKRTFNGYDFFEKNDQWFRWYTKIGKTDAGFNYLPDEVAGIPIDGTIQRLASPAQISITSDLNDIFAEEIALAETQAEMTLSNFNIFAVKAFTAENEYGWPVITCNQSAASTVIYFKEANETKITVHGGCILADANQMSDILVLRDRIVYALLGILNE